MRKLSVFLFALCTVMMMVVNGNASNDDFNYVADQFADVRVLRYQIPGFDELTLEQKELAYYLSEAARAGRDIYWDQNYKYNLAIRHVLEYIVKNFDGDRETDNFKSFMVYTKRVWFSNGIHHHYSNDKFVPGFSEEYFRYLVNESVITQSSQKGASDIEGLSNIIRPIMFDASLDAKKVNLNSDHDIVLSSAVNFYDGVTEKEITEYFLSITDADDPTPVSHGLNSKRVKENGQIIEKVYKVGGLYSQAIERIVYWLNKAVLVAESDLQAQALIKLIEYYQTGDLAKFDEYNILWVQDTTSVVDTVNGFIEVYDDPLGHTGSWEAVVSIKDMDATRKFSVLGHEAQWFEDHSPIAREHKREKVSGVSYKIITVVQESGASSPATPIGINLPNSEWIRERHGSKSVSLGNIEDAYEKASKGATLEEFYLPEQRPLMEQYGEIASRLHTGLHEVVGHASGKLEPGVLPPHQTLKNYASALEEARADLVGLYYVGDQRLVDLGLSPTTDIIKASYIQYINNGLLKQLSRIEPGKDIEESHMRNRQMIAAWVYEKGQEERVIERVDITVEDGVKTYFVIDDYERLRELFGELLKEVQRIKSQGDFDAGQALIETYGVKVDQELHEQVRRRWSKLNIAPYAGFINPTLRAVYDYEGNVVDVIVDYPNDFTEQMLAYGRQAVLPVYP